MLSVLKKCSLTRCRLSRKVLNFVFLRVGAVHRYRPRVKNEKRKKCCKFNTYSIFKTPPSTLRVPVLFEIFINFIGNIYFNTIVIIFNCGFNQTQPFRQKIGKCDIAETIPQLSISQHFAIISGLPMAATKKSKVELITTSPTILFHKVYA